MDEQPNARPNNDYLLTSSPNKLSTDNSSPPPSPSSLVPPCHREPPSSDHQIDGLAQEFMPHVCFFDPGQAAVESLEFVSEAGVVDS